MSSRDEGLLTEVATAIGTTLGRVANTTNQIVDTAKREVSKRTAQGKTKARTAKKRVRKAAKAAKKASRRAVSSAKRARKVARTSVRRGAKRARHAAR